MTKGKGIRERDAKRNRTREEGWQRKKEQGKRGWQRGKGQGDGNVEWERIWGR